MRIDVYEQDSTLIDFIRKIITEISIQENLELEVKWFYGPNAVKGYFDLQGSVSIVLIDMSIPSAEEISKKYFNQHRSCRQLIYGKSCETLPDWIPFGPTGYCSSAVAIPKELVRLLREVICDTCWFHFVNRRQSIHIPFDEIVYFQSDLRYVDIVDISGNQTRIMAKLDDMEANGLGTSFIRIHKSYLVGKKFIRAVRYSEHIASLLTGTELPISQNYYPAVKTWESNLNKYNIIL